MARWRRWPSIRRAGGTGGLVAFGAFGWVGKHQDGRATMGHPWRRNESGGATAQVALGLLAVGVGSKTGHGVRRRSRRRQDDSGGWTQRLVAARAERDGAALRGRRQGK
jgi:hypothetical protein